MVTVREPMQRAPWTKPVSAPKARAVGSNAAAHGNASGSKNTDAVTCEPVDVPGIRLGCECQTALRRSLAWRIRCW